jgi:curved DNA-binding protein
MINLDMEFKDYYKTLNISFGASDEEIKKSYKQLAKKYHPDSDGGSEEKFKEIQEAYEVLKDKIKRDKYDSMHNSQTNFSSKNNTYQSKSSSYSYTNASSNNSSTTNSQANANSQTNTKTNDNNASSANNTQQS